MTWQLHTPCGILCQLNRHLDSRSQERFGIRTSILSVSLEVLKDEYFHSILQPKQYHRFKHMIWIGFWFTFIPARKFDIPSGKPRWDRLGARFQVNIKFIQLLLDLREKPLCGSFPLSLYKFLTQILRSFFFPGLRFDLCEIKWHCLLMEFFVIFWYF